MTRKGAIRAGVEELGIIPGSIGAKSFIVRGKGSKASFCSCSHGAGRKMSRTAAKRPFNRFDLEKMIEGVECRKDKGVVDEIPARTGRICKRRVSALYEGVGRSHAGGDLLYSPRVRYSNDLLS